MDELPDLIAGTVTLGAALVDLDGCLCDDSARRPLAEAERFAEYHARCPEDPPHEAECALVRAWAAAGGRVIYATARTADRARDTVAWLREQGLPDRDLRMRAPSDHRPSVEIKRQWLTELLAQGERIAFALDDSDSVVRMYRAAGVTCLQPRSEAHHRNGDGTTHPAAHLIRRAEATYKERRAAYGPAERRFGAAMAALFPGGVELKSVDDWVRWGLLTQVVSKLVRYCNDPLRGHLDSAHDLGVYSFMLEAEDRRLAEQAGDSLPVANEETSPPYCSSYGTGRCDCA